MPYNPVIASLYVTFKNITHDAGLLPLLHRSPAPAQATLHDAYHQEITYRQQQISALTEPPSELEPYRVIMFLCSGALHNLFMTTTMPAVHMVDDIMCRRPASQTIQIIEQERHRYLQNLRDVLRLQKTDPQGLIPSIKQKAEKVHTMMEENTILLTDDEYFGLIHLAEEAQALRDTLNGRYDIALPIT